MQKYQKSTFCPVILPEPLSYYVSYNKPRFTHPSPMNAIKSIIKATTGGGGVREACIRHVHKPCVSGAIPSQTYGNVWYRFVIELLQWHKVCEIGGDKLHRPPVVALNSKRTQEEYYFPAPV